MSESSKMEALSHDGDKKNAPERRLDANLPPSEGQKVTPELPRCPYWKCGKLFTPGRKGQKYCCDQHRKFACRDRKLDLVRAEAAKAAIENVLRVMKQHWCEHIQFAAMERLVRDLIPSPNKPSKE